PIRPCATGSSRPASGPRASLARSTSTATARARRGWSRSSSHWSRIPDVEVGQTDRMHFEAEHTFPGSRAAGPAGLCDPDFHTNLDLPDLSRPTVVEHGDDGTTRTLTLRYEYVGQLDPIARKVIAGRQLTWIQALRLDTTTFAGTLTFSAEAAPDRL